MMPVGGALIQLYGLIQLTPTNLAMIRIWLIPTGAGGPIIPFAEPMPLSSGVHVPPVLLKQKIACAKLMKSCVKSPVSPDQA